LDSATTLKMHSELIGGMREALAGNEPETYDHMLAIYRQHFGDDAAKQLDTVARQEAPNAPVPVVGAAAETPEAQTQAPQAQGVAEKATNVAPEATVAKQPGELTSNGPTIEDVPPGILRKIMVPVERYHEEEGVKTEHVPADEALAENHEELSAYQRLLDCVRAA
jgi:hypothetical protein